MVKTEEQKYREIFEIAKKFVCEDTLEVKEMILDINSKVSDEARQINKESIVIDTCTFSLEEYSWNLKESGVTGINCTVPGTKDDAGHAMRNIIDYFSYVNNDDNLMMVYEANDIIRAKKEGKVGVIIGAQSCEFVHHNDIDASIQAFHKMGLRIMGIAYNHRTFAADGCFAGTDAGLSKDGEKMIDAMQKYGVTVDLSHAGCRSTLDAMEICRRPPVFTHSNPKGILDSPRNITDEQAKKCAALGGVVGVVSYAPTLWDGKNFPTIEKFIDCIDYYVNLIGIEHVGIGIDSPATIGAYEHRDIIYFSKHIREIHGQDSMEYRSYEAGRGPLGMCLEGLMNIANMVNITDHLLKRGYCKKDIQKILGENWLRVFGDSW